MRKNSLILMLLFSVTFSCRNEDSKYLELVQQINVSSGSDENALQQFEEGKNKYLSGNYTEARENFYHALRSRPDWWEPYYYLSLISTKSEQYENAMEYLTLSLYQDNPIEVYEEIYQKIRSDDALLPLKKSKYGDRLDFMLKKFVSVIDLYKLSRKYGRISSISELNSTKRLNLIIPSRKDLASLKGLAGVKYLKNITEIIIITRTNIDEQLKYLEGNPNIKSLSVFLINGEGLKYLSGMTKLRTLKVMNGTNLNNNNIKYIEDIKPLKELYFDSATVTENGLMHIANTKVEILYLSYSTIDNKSLSVLSKSNIEILVLSYSNLNDIGVCSLENSKINILSIAGTQVTDKGIDCILRMKNLHAVNITDVNLSKYSIEKLLKKNLINQYSLP